MTRRRPWRRPSGREKGPQKEAWEDAGKAHQVQVP